jgi:hypothetical protein
MDVVSAGLQIPSAFHPHRYKKPDPASDRGTRRHRGPHLNDDTSSHKLAAKKGMLAKSPDTQENESHYHISPLQV